MLRDSVLTALLLEMGFGRGVPSPLYFCAMVDDWRRQCPQAGVTFCYHFGFKMVGDCNPKARLLRSCITLSKFEDDATLYASSCTDFEMVASSFVAVTKLWGLTVSLVKSVW